MSVRTRDNMIATINTILTTNGVGGITGAQMNSICQDLADSALFAEDGITSVPVSSAEILSLYTTPKELVAAPGSGKIIMPIAIFGQYNYLTAAYATYTSMSFGYDSSSAGNALNIKTLAGILNQMANFSFWTDPLNDTSTNSLTTTPNKNFCISSGSGNPTAGSGSLIIHTIYKVITL